MKVLKFGSVIVRHFLPIRATGGTLKVRITVLSLFFTTPMYAAPCGIHGSAQPGSREYTLNSFKNRSQAPQAVNPSITLKRLARGETFKNTEAAAIIAYAALVKPGGKETCNCKAGDAAHKDTHIALVTDPADAADKSKHVVVEVTPRSRRLYHFPSTATLQKQILHTRVMVTGWPVRSDFRGNPTPSPQDRR